MLSASVAQNPTMAVREGTKNRKNAAGVSNWLGRESMGPNPPTWLIAQNKSARPATMRKGAAQPSSLRMLSGPRTMTYILMSQKTMKQIPGPAPKLDQAGQTNCIVALIAAPPIQV